MNHTKNFCLFFFFFPTLLWGGPLFHQNNEIREVNTTYFRILYASSQKKTVARLVSIADKIYEEWIKRLGLTKTYRFLVIITPDIELMNGMFTSLPRNTIVLYEYVSDPLLVPSDDALYALFTHELLHAISLNVKTGFWDILSFSMGDFLSPQAIQLPWWMIEGIAVSGESLSGHGRVNSPSHRAILVQHLLENRFEDYSDVAQIRFEKGNYHYIYGGFFSTYLQQKYGWEKYGELFKVSSKRFWPYSFESTFKKVYGVAMKNEWRAFQSNFMIETSPLLIEEKELFKEKSLFVRSTKKGVYIVDKSKERIYHLNGEKLSFIGHGVNIASDGNTIAFRRLHYVEGKPRDGFVIIQKKKKFFLHRIIDMDILNETYLMVEAEGFETRLIFQENNTKKILIENHPQRQFLFPRFVDEKRAVFILLLTNRPYLGVWEREKDLFRFYDFSEYEITSLCVDGEDIWMTLYPRKNNTLGKLGRFSLKDESLWLTTIEVNGGFHHIAAQGDTLYRVKRLTDNQHCVAIDKKLLLTKIPAREEKKQPVELILSSPANTLPLLLSETTGRKWSDQLPGVRIPLIYPDLIFLRYGHVRWNFSLYLYNEDPLQENKTSLEVHHLSPWNLTLLYGTWENFFFYPFSVFVRGGTSADFSRFSDKSLTIGFSYQWDKSSLENIMWRNSLSIFSSPWLYRYQVVWSHHERKYQSTPYSVFRGPLFLEGTIDAASNYYVYGNLVYSIKNLSLALLGGWGNVGFFSPLTIPRNYLTLSSVSSVSPETISYGGSVLHNGALGAHGFLITPFVVEIGLGHFPIYFHSIGFVIGAYGFWLHLNTTPREFYAGYFQVYGRWIFGYTIPLTFLWEYQYTSDGLYTAVGISSSF